MKKRSLFFPMLLFLSSPLFYQNCDIPFDTTPTVDNPEITPGSGFYYPFTASITTTTLGATIYFTIDGTSPTEDSSVYGLPIPVDADMVMMAFAKEAGYKDSSIVSAEYTILDGDIAFSSDVVNLPITDNTATSSPLMVDEAPSSIHSLTVTVTITHTYDHDLEIYLISPAGTEIELSTDNGGSGANYTATIFDDTAGTSITAGSAPFSGGYIPEEPLATLTGENANGTWTLRVFDDGPGDTGTLVSWGITFSE